VNAINKAAEEMNMKAWLNKEPGKRATGVKRRTPGGVRVIMDFVTSAAPVPLRAGGISTVLALLVLGLAGSAAASTEPANARVTTDFSTFKLITERNIFNSHRAVKSARTEPRPPPRIDTLILVGTLRYEKGVFAFFEGSSSEYRKVLKVADRIAGYELTDIEPASVKLAAAAGDIQLSVGRHLRREEGGDWRVAENTEKPDFTDPGLVRLMEKRKQETGK
jgi:hypothetical protein